MAVKTPLVITNGQIEQLQAGDNILATSSATETTMNAGTGGVTIRDVVYVSSTGTAIKAQANGQVAAAAYGFATATASAGNPVAIRTDGVITGFSSLTPGGIVFLDASTAGGVTQTAPTTAGQFVVSLGRAISATDIEIEIEPPIKL